MTAAERLRVECLTSIQAFEVHWAYFIQSDGEIFADQTLSACRTFLKVYDELYPELPAIGDPEKLSLGADTGVADIIGRLKAWSEGERDLPYDRADESRFMLFSFFGGLKMLLSRQLDVAEWPAYMTTAERQFSSRFVRWRGHFPRKLLVKDPRVLLENASGSDTIVVLADIRRSQDLMTYAKSPEDFATRMLEFVSVTRVLSERQFGIFDKFTGDGFLVYFNEAVCAEAGKDFLSCFFWFLEAYRPFAQKHFKAWAAEVRKLPSSGIGLAIGADVGRVKFTDLDGLFVAVGDAIVWASRLAASARVNETLLNNLLAARMSGRPRVILEPRAGETKTGEDFMAHSMIIERTISD